MISIVEIENRVKAPSHISRHMCRLDKKHSVESETAENIVDSIQIKK